MRCAGRQERGLGLGARLREASTAARLRQVASDTSLTGPLKFLTGAAPMVPVPPPRLYTGLSGSDVVADLYNVKTLDGGLTDHNSGHLRPQVDLAILSKARRGGPHSARPVRPGRADSLS